MLGVDALGFLDLVFEDADPAGGLDGGAVVDELTGAGGDAQLPTRQEPGTALKFLLEHCGRSTGRWEALDAAVTFEYDDTKLTFGELLASLDGTPVTTVDT